MVKMRCPENLEKAKVIVPKRCCQCLRQSKARTPGHVICHYHHVLAWANSIACEDYDDVEVF